MCQRHRRPDSGCRSARGGFRTSELKLLIVMKLFARLKAVLPSLERNGIISVYETGIASVIASTLTCLRKTMEIPLWRSKRCSTVLRRSRWISPDLRNYQRLTGIELFKVKLDKQHAHEPEGGWVNWSYRERPGQDRWGPIRSHRMSSSVMHLDYLRLLVVF